MFFSLRTGRDREFCMFPVCNRWQRY